MDAPTPDSDLEDLPELVTSGPESRIRAKVLFFVAALFLFGLAIILPPNNPQIKPTSTKAALAPVIDQVENLETSVIAKDPDIFKIQNEVFDLKAKIKELPQQLEHVVKVTAKQLSEPIDNTSPRQAADSDEDPTESAAVRAVAYLFSHKWFLLSMAALWAFIILDGIVGVIQAPDSKFKAIRRLWLVTLIPPMRMAFSPARPNHEVWFPRAGWLPVNKESGEVMELVLAMPMLFLTLSIVPIEIVERFYPHLVVNIPTVAYILHLLGACIWFAFVVEFIMLYGVAQNKILYCKRHWVNLIIIILPLIAFLRFLRITRIVRLIRAGKLMRVYRIRGVYVRAMRVAVLFSLLDRLLSRKPEKYLAKLEDQIAEKRAELEGLEQNAIELRKEIEAGCQGTPESPGQPPA